MHLHYTALLSAMISIQCGASLAKQLFPKLGAAGTTVYRLAFATAILLALFRPWRKKISRAGWRAAALYGVTLGTMNLLFYLSLERIPLGLAVAIEFTGPLSLALWGSRKPLDFLWAGLAILGLAMLLPLNPNNTQAVDPVGIALALGAGLFWALYILTGKNLGARLDSGIAATLGMLVATCVATPYGVAVAGTKLLDASVLPIALGIGLFSSALPYSLELYALKKIPTVTFSIIMSLEPAIAAASGFVFLHENLTPTQVLAIVCVMIASLGSALTAKWQLVNP